MPPPTCAAAPWCAARAGARSAPRRPASAKADSPGAVVYSQNRAACHQATAPASQAPFRRRPATAPALLAGDGGRDYLAHVLLFGLNGPIMVDGKTCNGQMPDWGAILSNAEIAQALNYVLTVWRNNQNLPVGFKPYDAAEIAAARRARRSAGSASTRRTTPNRSRRRTRLYRVRSSTQRG